MGVGYRLRKAEQMTMKKRFSLVIPAVLGCVVLMSACSEKPQTAGTQAKGGAKVWQGGQASFNAAGWKPGDEAAWSEQIKQRNRAQNEYVRIAP